MAGGSHLGCGPPRHFLPTARCRSVPGKTDVPPTPVTIIHLDARILVCAKPPGLLTVAPPRGSGSAAAEDTLVDRLRREGHPEVLAVHRLDRETTGVVVFARDAGTRDLLMDLFKGRRVRKTYLGVVQGHPSPPEGVLRFPIRDLGASAVIAKDGQPAETRYRTLERVGPAALLELELLTGRHNQARLHLAHIGHPLVGERKYAYGRDAVVRHKRAALHACRLAFVPPGDTGERVFEAALPKDLENLLAKLRGMPARPPERRPPVPARRGGRRDRS